MPKFAIVTGASSGIGLEIAKLAALIGKREFVTFGAPRPGRDDNPSMGTGAYALDQSWHWLWLGVAALVTAVA